MYTLVNSTQQWSENKFILQDNEVRIIYKIEVLDNTYWGIMLLQVEVTITELGYLCKLKITIVGQSYYHKTMSRLQNEIAIVEKIVIIFGRFDGWRGKSLCQRSWMSVLDMNLLNEEFGLGFPLHRVFPSLSAYI